MPHLDEGTIHAWLDGALGTDESAAVEAHVAGCRGCADRVAEARGYIAASSRILSALDHVPADVVPAREPAAAAARGPVPAAAAPPPNAAATGTAAASPSMPPSRWGHRYARAAAVIAVVAAGTLLVARESERDGQRAAAPVAPIAERRAADSPHAAPAPAMAASRPLDKAAPAPKTTAPPDSAVRAREKAFSVTRRTAADAAAGAVRPSSASTEARTLHQPAPQARAMPLAAVRPRLLSADTLASAPRSIRQTYLVGADTVRLEATALAALPNAQLRAARDSSSGLPNAIHWVGRDGTSYVLSGRVSTQALEQIRVALGKR